MMMLPSVGVLDQLARERQRGLRAAAAVPRHSSRPGVLRLRIGRALILAGSAVSGERVEMPARPHTLPRTA